MNGVGIHPAQTRVRITPVLLSALLSEPHSTPPEKSGGVFQSEKRRLWQQPLSDKLSAGFYRRSIMA